MNHSKKKESGLFNFIKKYTFIFIVFLLVVAPFSVTNAAAIDCKNSGLTQSATLGDVVSYFVCFLNDLVVPLIFALALVYFIWGVVQYYLNPDNEEKRAKGKEFIIGGLVALFVMIGVWGLVGILTNTFKVDVKVLPQTPTTAE